MILKTLVHKIPENLEKVFKSYDYKENGGMVISELIYDDKDLVVTFHLYPSSDRETKQVWKLTIKNIIDEKFTRSWTYFFTFYSDHFLLYEFIEPHTELYFNGKATAPEKLFVDLYKSHLKTYSRDFHFAQGINGATDIFNLCKTTSGLFARGPKKIMEKYQICLAKHNIKSNFVGGIPKTDKNLKLLIFGESYFIGEEFLFTEV